MTTFTQEHVEEILNLLPAGVVVIDNTGVVITVNPAAISLLGEPLVGISWTEIIERAFEPKKNDGHEVSLKNNKLVSVSTIALERSVGQLILLMDMTETRNLQGRLNHHHRLSDLGRMVASLAHQIRTPLATALLYAENLKKENLDKIKRHKFAEKIISKLNHMETQINDMLIFAKGGSHIVEKINVKFFLESILSEKKRWYRQVTGLKLNCNFMEEALQLKLHVNIDSLLSAVQNIINNALEAKEKNLQLSIHCMLISESKLLLVIEDNGPGMDTETLSKVSDPFYTTKTHGTGLGLPVVKAVVEAHKGQFVLYSEVGIGTKAIITLPLI